MILSMWRRWLPSTRLLLGPVFCVGLIALIWAALSYEIRYEREAVIANRFKDQEALARLFEAHARGVLEAARATLIDVETDFRQQGRRLDLERYFRERVKSGPFRFITIVDGDGSIVLSSVPLTTPINVRETESFQYHLNNTDLDPFVAKPRLGKMVGKWTVHVTRRMNRPDGTFDGNTTIAIDPEYLSRFYDEISLEPNSVAALVGRDGIVRARRFNEKSDAGGDLGQSPLFTTHLPAREAGNGVWASPSDGVLRLFSFRTVKGFPLVVVLGSSEEVALAPMNERQHIYRWWAGVISIAIFAFGVLVMLLGLRRQRYEQALLASDNSLQKAQAVAHVGSWSWHVPEGRVEWSAEMHRIFGIPKDGFPGNLADVIVRAIHPDDRAAVDEATRSVIRDKSLKALEFRVVRPDGTVRAVLAEAGELSLDEKGNAAVMTGIVRDITERKQSELLLHTRLQLAKLGETGSMDEVLQAALDAAEGITASQIGFFHFVDPDQEHLTLQTWSTNTLARMCTAEAKGKHYPISEAGVWVDCFYTQAPAIYNDYSSIANKKGMPAGHALIKRALVVPILRAGKVTEILGVGNKLAEYTQTDVEEVKLIAELVQDIVDRRRAEAAAGESDARFRTLVEQAGDGFELFDEQGRFLDVNKATCAQLGYSRDELLQLSVFDIDPELTREHFASALESLTRQSPLTFDTTHQRKGGAIFPVEVSASIVQFGGQRRCLAVVRDITERKRMEEALRESEVRFRSLTELSSDWYWEQDRELRLTFHSSGFERHSGTTSVKLLGKRRWEEPNRFPLRGTWDEHRIMLEAHKPFRNFEYCRISGDGKQTFVSLSGMPIYDAAGEFNGYRGVGTNITERKRIENLHLQAQKLESLGTLTGGIAHDFNNILAAIRGNADLAARDVRPDHIAAESLKEIIKASTRASELVRRIMAFGRPKEARHETVDLSAVVSEVLILLRSTLPTTISLSKDFAVDASYALADAGQVHEAIVNLTTNAAYAIGPRSGSIEYRLEPAQVGDELARGIPGLNSGRYARLTVKDSGCGMDAATLEHIFDAFYTTKPVGEGTGLGLSMVHGIMKSHGGAVTVESIPGKGSSFHLYFPAAGMQAVVAGESVPAQSLSSAGRRVLYVDDEEALALLAERFLSRLGHSVSGFTDPEEALAAFRSHPQEFDIVVTDLSMPHMSGFELARAVRSVRPEMPVLMTTGYVRAEDEATARDVGIRELILKPTTMDELARVLNRLLRSGEQNGKPPA